MAGLIAGAANGSVLNGISAVKYHSWNSSVRVGNGKGFTEPGPIESCRVMWAKGGVRPFLNGIAPTVVRDMVFGGTFAVARSSLHTAFEQWGKDEENSSGLSSGEQQQQQQQPPRFSFALTMTAAAMATVFSSPFNYARNMKFATEAGQVSPGTYQSIAQLVASSKAAESPWRFLQLRLRIGWGALRVAVGMATGSWLYENIKGGLMD
jgi:hypothetical protein